MELISNQPLDESRHLAKLGVLRTNTAANIFIGELPDDFSSGNSLHIFEERRISSMMRKDWVYRKGDIYYADLSPVKGSEQGGSRPVIVIQNNTGNRYSPTLIVAIVTTKVNKKTNFPTHHLIDKNQALTQPSEVMLEQIRTIDKCRIDRYLGKVSAEDMSAIDDALLISLALEYVKETKAVSINCDGLSPKL